MTSRIEQRSAQPYAAIAATTSMRGGFGDVIDEALPAVREHLASLGDRAGWPAARDLPRDRHGGRPADRGGLAHDGGDRLDEPHPPRDAPAGRYAVFTHVGPYDGLVDTNEALQREADDQGLRFAMTDEPGGERWEARFESYRSDPDADPDPARWETDIAYLLAD